MDQTKHCCYLVLSLVQDHLKEKWNNLFSDYYVEDGSFFRLQNIQLGYTLRDEFTEQIGLDKLRFYVSGNNLFTITDYKGYDPTTSNGSPIGGGIDKGFYPSPKMYLVGLNVNF